VLAGVCMCWSFNLDEDGAIPLPATGRDAQPLDPSLKADKSFLAAQEALKQASAVPDPDPDDYGLTEAKKAAEAAAFSEAANEQSLGDSMLMADFVPTKKNAHQNQRADAIMGKLIMSDLFSNKELEHMKMALTAYSNSHGDLGESNAHTDPDHVTLAKGLSIALRDKAQAEEKAHAAEQELARRKQAHASKLQLNAATLNACKEHIATLNAKSKQMHHKFLNVKGKLQQAETQHHLSKRGFELCASRAKATEAQIRSLKASAIEHMGKESSSETHATKLNSNKPSKDSSACCQTCAKLTNKEKSLLNADCSGCQ